MLVLIQKVWSIFNTVRPVGTNNVRPNIVPCPSMYWFRTMERACLSVPCRPVNPVARTTESSDYTKTHRIADNSIISTFHRLTQINQFIQKHKVS